MDGPIVIVGSGAMACLFGARLSPYVDVIMLAGWPPAVEALQSAGIELDLDGSATRFQVKVATEPDEIPSASVALILVKTWQTERAAGQVAEFLAEDGVALTLQNGLGNLEKLQAALGPARAALGVTTYGATLLAPGRVRPAGGGNIQLGRHPRVLPLVDIFTMAELEVRQVDDVTGLAWGKLAVNAGINPLTALLRVPNGQVADQPDARRILTHAVTEVSEVAHAAGIELPFADPVAATLAVARRTRDNRSSMLQDLDRGAPTEIDAISGAVVAKAEELGRSAPVNETLWRLVRSVVHQGDRQ
ncbi:MAG: 2-dehydropantoate 2-reductase [Anaerolineales bacterium]